MAGRPKTRLRRSALEKIERGEPLTPEEEAVMGSGYASTLGSRASAAMSESRSFAGNTAKIDPTGAKTGIKDRDMNAAASRIAEHPEVLSLLSSQLVEEPQGATFSHQAVQLLAQSGTPDTEIAKLLGISVKVLKDEAAEALDIGSTQHRVSLRIGQYRAAMVGDRSLLIWLGKQSLGQVDRAVNEIGGRDGKPIEISDGATEVRGKLMNLIAMVQGDKTDALAEPVALALPSANAGKPD
jgi:hypothetical protein